MSDNKTDAAFEKYLLDPIVQQAIEKLGGGTLPAPPTRDKRRESDEFYAAVGFLRRLGHRVVRVSTYQSAIDGTLLRPKEIKSIARQLGWNAKPVDA